jgi:hypothetical protein
MDFSDVTIYIPTKGRAGKQVTLDFLGDELRGACTLLVEDDEFDDYRLSVDNVNIVAMPPEVKGIPGTLKLEKCDSYMMEDLFEELVNWMSLDDVPVVGVSVRQGNNHNSNIYQEHTRQMGFHGIDVQRFKTLGLRFDGQDLMEDFYMTLSLLTKGIANRVMYQYCWNQAGSGAAGGCSSYRTWEIQKRCAEELAASFPDFVTVVEKTTKTTWKEFPTRFDVRVQWKKAYEKGIGYKL